MFPTKIFVGKIQKDTVLLNEIDDVVFNTALKKLSAANDYFAATIPDYTGGVASNVKQVNANIFGPGPDTRYGMMYTKEVQKT